MKLVIFPFENKIEIANDRLTTLEISNLSLFNQVLETLYALNNNRLGSESIRLYDAEMEELSICHEVLLLGDYFDFKKYDALATKSLLKDLEKNLKTDVEISQKITQKVLELSTIFEAEVLDYTSMIHFELNPSFTDVLKLFKFSIKVSEAPSVFERMLELIDTISEFSVSQLLILVNLRVFLNEKELGEIKKHIIAKKVNVLLIESSLSLGKRDFERIYQIDEDYEEFIL